MAYEKRSSFRPNNTHNNPSWQSSNTANAWEDGDEVVLYSCRFTDIDLEIASGPVRKSLGHYQNELYKMRFNLNTGEASQKKLSESAVDFPRINEKYIGRKQRFVYGTRVDSLAKVEGIVKFDLQLEPEVGKNKLRLEAMLKAYFNSVMDDMVLKQFLYQEKLM